MRRPGPVLLTTTQLDAIERVYVRPGRGLEDADPMLVDVFTELHRLRQVHARAEKLVRAVNAGDEGCICDARRVRGKLVHGRACPVKLLEQDVRRAGGLRG